jgi:DNA-binding MarR family transcriptional regulator
MRLKDNPATQLAWKIAMIYRLHMQNIAGVTEHYGLYPGQSRILNTISEMGGSTQKEIADRLDISPASIAVSIKRMQKAGIVEKTADEHDLRNNRISITEKGWQIQAESQPEFMMFDNCLLKGFSPGEIGQLDDYLTRIQANLREAKNQDDGT